MKKSALSLFIVILTATVFISSCKKENYPPSLSLKLEPYVVYYQDTKYVLYNEQGIKDPSISDEVIKRGDVQSFIDTVTLNKYTVDDKGEFWSAETLNSNYKYPGYRVSGYGETDPTVTVTYDPSIGIETDGHIDLGLASSSSNPYYTFTYTATDNGETSTKKVHLRVYNSYSNLEGIYLSRLSKINDGGNPGASYWTDDYGYGDAKSVKFSVDGSVDKKMKINRIMNNNKLKGVIKGELGTFPSSCVLGDKKNEDHDIIETIVQGKVVENDYYISTFPADQQDTVTTLVVMSNRLVNNLTTGLISNITVKDSKGNDTQVPLIAIEYKIRRYKRDASTGTSDYISTDGSHWKSINGLLWENTFRETFIKQVYWTEDNKDAINNASGH